MTILPADFVRNKLLADGVSEGPFLETFRKELALLEEQTRNEYLTRVDAILADFVDFYTQGGYKTTEFYANKATEYT